MDSFIFAVNAVLPLILIVCIGYALITAFHAHCITLFETGRGRVTGNARGQ